MIAADDVSHRGKTEPNLQSLHSEALAVVNHASFSRASPALSPANLPWSDADMAEPASASSANDVDYCVRLSDAYLGRGKDDRLRPRN